MDQGQIDLCVDILDFRSSWENYGEYYDVIRVLQNSYIYIDIFTIIVLNSTMPKYKITSISIWLRWGVGKPHSLHPAPVVPNTPRNKPGRSRE